MTSGRVATDFVAALETPTAEIGGGEMTLLQHRPHGPIENEDTLSEGIQKGLAS